MAIQISTDGLEASTATDDLRSLHRKSLAILKRLQTHAMDPETGEIYHVTFKPPPPEIANRLIQRKDDTHDTVRKRLKAYHSQTKPLGDWYEAKGLLISVDGSGSIEEVRQTVSSAVSRL